jgi:hypothetical protein
MVSNKVANRCGFRVMKSKAGGVNEAKKMF